MNDTICAISTAPGMGAIAIIRLSGEKAFDITDSAFNALNPEKNVSGAKSHTAVFGNIKDGDEIVDEVLVTVFKKPHSFTGEDSVEISCHGSVYIQQRIIHILLKKGCRMAQPGEYTRRAFQNGKMDLSQAEAVADLISSTTRANHRLAMQQMRGGISKEIDNLRGKMLKFLSLIELELDFSEEDVEFADRKQLKELTNTIEKKIHKLTDSFKTGNAIKNGIPTAIVGETNAGKSTLLNNLLNEEKAIVSDIHGTTRDVIEDTAIINGVEFRFIDTAGLRDTEDSIEKMGIERSYRQIEQAEIVLLVIDATCISNQKDLLTNKILPRTKDKNLIILFNKCDKLSDEENDFLDEIFNEYAARGTSLHISAKSNINIDKLKDTLVNIAGISDISKQDVVITNLRHYEALSSAHEAILRVQKGLDDELSGDFLSQDLRECNHYLSQITGTISTEEVLGNIFKNFCIGK